MTMVERESKSFVVGQRVWVYDVNDRRGNGPIEGTVEKVGRTLIHVRYVTWGDPVPFRMDTGRANDNYGHQWIKSDAKKALDERRDAALKVLYGHGLEIKMGYSRHLSTEMIEAIADLLGRADVTTERTE
jgi:hypothetical protein